MKKNANSNNDNLVFEKIDSAKSVNILKNILNGMDAYLYVSDPITNEILFINDKMRQHFSFQGEVVGKICWKVFQDNFNERCDFCPVKKLLEEPDSVVVWEAYNTMTKRYYKNSDRLIHWIDGQLVHIQHSVDITELKQADLILERKLSQQELLYKVSQSFIRAENMNDFITEALELTSQFTLFDRVMLELLNPEHNAFYVADEYSTRKTQKNPRSKNLALPFSPGSKPYELLVTRDIPYIAINDFIFEMYPELAPFASDIRAFLILPIKVNNKIVGLLEFHNCTEPHIWSEDDIQLGSLLANLFSAVINKEQMKQDLNKIEKLAKSTSKIADTDYLSQLMSRRAMDKHLAKKILNADTSIKHFIFMLDIDNFKKTNDSYGHDIGDKVIIMLAQVIRDSAVSGNAARWGGEEFLISIDADSKYAATQVATNIVRNFSQKTIESSPGVFFSSTVSCGVSEMIAGETYVNAITRADQALYIAKSEGKNCVRYAEINVEKDNILSCYNPNQYALSSTNNSLYNDVMTHAIQVLFYINDSNMMIDELLKIVTIYTDLDRVYLFEKTDKNTLAVTHKYDPENTGMQKFELMPLEKEGEYTEADLQVSRFISDISSVIKSVHSETLPQDLKSYARIPIYSNHQFVGLVRLEYCREKHDWTTDEHHIFEYLAVFLGEAVTRNKLETKLEVSQSTLKTILDSIDDLVYVVDFDTKKLLFANKMLRDKYDNDFLTTRKTCWEILRPDIGKPCSFCQHNLLVGENAIARYRHDLYNSLTDQWFDITDTLINWDSDQKAVIMVCRDITHRKSSEKRMKSLIHNLEHQTSAHNFAMEMSGSFSWELSSDLKTIIFNNTISDVLGYSPEYFEDSFEKYLALFTHKESILEELQKYLSGNTDFFSIEHYLYAANGDIKKLLIRGKFFDDKKDLICGIGMDITEEHKSDILSQNLFL